MNAAFNHGSQGDFFSTLKEDDNKTTVIEEKKSIAPKGTGDNLREAARIGDYDKLKSILDLYPGDIVINEEDTIGTTALHTASSNGHKDCVILLLKCGADKELKNHYGQTAYSKASNEEIKALVKPINIEPDSWCMIM